MALSTIKTMPIATVFVGLLSLVGGQAMADDAPGGVTLRSFAYAGSGCAADAVTGNFPVDGNSFDIAWSGFNAEVGNGAPLRDKRKNCQINLDLDIPAGWQYTVKSVEYTGEVKLDTGVQGVASSSYYFQGSANTVRFNSLFEGPEDRVFQIRDTLASANQVWSPCGGGRSLNVNVSVRLDNSTDSSGTGSLFFGDVDGLAGTHLELDWRTCQ